MERLTALSKRLAANVPMDFIRYIDKDIDSDMQLIGISGARGCGKTVYMLQRMKKDKTKKSIYVSLDDIYFMENKLLHFATDFHAAGGEVLYLDEVHKYPNWSQELKNIYDYLPDLKVVFTSSSALDIYKGSHDLSRRAMVYKMKGLSMREFIELKYKISLPAYGFADIIENHTDIAIGLMKEIKPLPLFREYLEKGYYPFFRNAGRNYLKLLMNTVNLVLETDLPAIFNIDFSSVIKLKKLLAIIAGLVPFQPNIEKLARETGTSRDTLLKYLHYLDTAHILNVLRKENKGMSAMNKPEKIFLENSNLVYALGDFRANEGNIRETFFMNQLSVNHKVESSKKGDFIVDGKYVFEVGGKNKGFEQISGIENSFIAADGIENGAGNKIPLWLFGFMY